MSEAERKYWEMKVRLLLSEVAEIKRMLDATLPSATAMPVIAAGNKTESFRATIEK